MTKTAISLRCGLAGYSDLVHIYFPNEFELREVRERLARVGFPFQWVDEQAIVAPAGSSRVFTGLTWSLTRADVRRPTLGVSA